MAVPSPLRHVIVIAEMGCMGKDYIEEDKKLLRYAGAMGHEFVGIFTDGAERKVRCEVNTVDSALQHGEEDKEFTVYQRSQKGWKKVKALRDQGDENEKARA